MENNSTNSIYIENYFSEIELLNLLNQSLGMSCESLEYEQEGSDCFLMYDDDFVNSFKKSIFISWKSGTYQDFNLLKFNHDLATKLRTRILFESYQVIDSPTEYVLFDEEGIQVIEESKRRLSF